MKLKVRCPKCEFTMLTEQNPPLIGKSKKCVYCGKYFRIKSAKTGVSRIV